MTIVRGGFLLFGTNGGAPQCALNEEARLLLLSCSASSAVSVHVGGGGFPDELHAVARVCRHPRHLRRQAADRAAHGARRQQADCAGAAPPGRAAPRAEKGRQEGRHTTATQYTGPMWPSRGGPSERQVRPLPTQCRMVVSAAPDTTWTPDSSASPVASAHTAWRCPTIGCDPGPRAASRCRLARRARGLSSRARAHLPLRLQARGVPPPQAKGVILPSAGAAARHGAHGAHLRAGAHRAAA